MANCDVKCVAAMRAKGSFCSVPWKEEACKEVLAPHDWVSYCSTLYRLSQGRHQCQFVGWRENSNFNPPTLEGRSVSWHMRNPDVVSPSPERCVWMQRPKAQSGRTCPPH